MNVHLFLPFRRKARFNAILEGTSAYQLEKCETKTTASSELKVNESMSMLLAFPCGSKRVFPKTWTQTLGSS